MNSTKHQHDPGLYYKVAQHKCFGGKHTLTVQVQDTGSNSNTYHVYKVIDPANNMLADYFSMQTQVFEIVWFNNNLRIRLDY